MRRRSSAGSRVTRTPSSRGRHRRGSSRRPSRPGDPPRPARRANTAAQTAVQAAADHGAGDDVGQVVDAEQHPGGADDDADDAARAGEQQPPRRRRPAAAATTAVVSQKTVPPRAWPDGNEGPSALATRARRTPGGPGRRRPWCPCDSTRDPVRATARNSARPASSGRQEQGDADHAGDRHEQRVAEVGEQRARRQQLRAGLDRPLGGGAGRGRRARSAAPSGRARAGPRARATSARATAPRAGPARAAGRPARRASGCASGRARSPERGALPGTSVMPGSRWSAGAGGAGDRRRLLGPACGRARGGLVVVAAARRRARPGLLGLLLALGSAARGWRRGPARCRRRRRR